MQHFHKKAVVESMLVIILLTIAGFILILGILKVFISEAEAKTQEVICKGSVLLREKTYTELETIGGIKYTEVGSPLLCNTIDEKIPKDKAANKEKIKEELAKLMVSCWNQFGEGLIDDVFKAGDPFVNNCFVCYNIRLGEGSDFKKEDPLKTTDFLKFLFEEPYKISLSSKKCEKLKGLCRKENPDTDFYIKYTRVICEEKKESCFVPKEQFTSYGEYIQSFSGQGKIILGMENIVPGETYAISFGSPTDECSICNRLGIGTGAGVALGTLITLGTGPVGWVVGAGVAGVVGIVSYIGAEQAFEAGAVELRDLFSERDFSTIYFTTLKQLQEEELCSIAEE